MSSSNPEAAIVIKVKKFFVLITLFYHTRKENMKISVFGLGYVGLANAMLLAQHEEVMAYDIVPEKVERLAAGHSYLDEKEINDFLAREDIRVDFTTDFERQCGTATTC